MEKPLDSRLKINSQNQDDRVNQVNPDEMPNPTNFPPRFNERSQNIQISSSQQPLLNTIGKKVSIDETSFTPLTQLNSINTTPLSTISTSRPTILDFDNNKSNTMSTLNLNVFIQLKIGFRLIRAIRFKT